MLVLGRYANQSIQIGDDITITITGVQHDGKVRIGIQAPEEVKILRTELIGREPANRKED